MDAAGAFEKGRSALLALGLQRPDIIDSGVKDWDEARWGPHEGRLKPSMSVREQVRTPPPLTVLQPVFFLFLRA